MTDQLLNSSKSCSFHRGNDWQFDLEELSKGYWRLTITSLFGVTLKYEGTDQIALLKKGEEEVSHYDKSTASL